MARLDDIISGVREEMCVAPRPNAERAVLQELAGVLLATLGRVRAGVRSGAICPLRRDRAGGRTGFLGITADPLHWGHLVLAWRALEIHGLDRVVIHPQGDGGNKPDKTDKSLRHAMVRATLEDHQPFLHYSGLGLEHPDPAEVDFLRFVQRHRGEARAFLYIIGSDLVLLARHHLVPLLRHHVTEHPDLRCRIGLAVVNRAEEVQLLPDGENPGDILIHEEPVGCAWLNPISATALRENTCTSWMPSRARRVAIENGLYGLSGHRDLLRYEDRLSARFGLSGARHALNLARVEHGEPSADFRDGVVQANYGISVVVFLEESGSLREALEALVLRMQGRLKAAGLDGAVAFLPPASLHLTLYDLDPEWVNGERPPVTPISAALLDRRIQEVERVFRGAGAPGSLDAWVGGVGLGGGHAIVALVHFADPESLNVVLAMRSKLQDQTGIVLPGFAGHVSLGYRCREMTADEARRFLEVIGEFKTEESGRLPIRTAQLSYYQDLLHFVPVLAFDLQSGRIARLNVVPSLLRERGSRSDRNPGNPYGPLSPSKWMQHPEVARLIGEGRFHELGPVTAHVVPTLVCNQRCFFCTYGRAKENARSGPCAGNREGRCSGSARKTLSFQLFRRIVDELDENGVRGIIVTGGGEPTTCRYLPDALDYLRGREVDFALNTNGRLLRGELLRRVLLARPRYVRVSLNAGTPLVQSLTTGTDSFETVLANLREAMILKARLGVPTDLSVGFVVSVVNVHDIMSLVRRLAGLEQDLRRELGEGPTLHSLQLRPVTNYEGSKHFDRARIERVGAYLRERFGDSWEREFRDFMYARAQVSAQTMDLALSVIEEQAVPFLREAGSRFRLVYPRQKFIDLPRVTRKPYSRCLSCPLFLFVWPDGSVYHCVEWAGTEGFAIGNLNRTRLSEILRSQERAELLRKIDEEVIGSRCPPVCARQEMNLLLDGFAGGAPSLDEARLDTLCSEAVPPEHVNFL